MTTVTVSPKFQVVIPAQVRKEFHLKSGQKLQVFAYQGRIELMPVEDIRKYRGILKGIDTKNVREKKDRAI